MSKPSSRHVDVLISFLGNETKVEKVLKLLIAARTEYLTAKSSVPYSTYSVSISVLRQMRGAKNHSYFRAFYPEEIQALHASLRFLIMANVQQEDKQAIAELYYALQDSSPIFDWNLPRFG